MTWLGLHRGRPQTLVVVWSVRRSAIASWNYGLGGRMGRRPDRREALCSSLQLRAGRDDMDRTTATPRCGRSPVDC